MHYRLIRCDIYTGTLPGALRCDSYNDNLIGEYHLVKIPSESTFLTFYMEYISPTVSIMFPNIIILGDSQVTDNTLEVHAAKHHRPLNFISEPCYSVDTQWDAILVIYANGYLMNPNLVVNGQKNSTPRSSTCKIAELVDKWWPDSANCFILLVLSTYININSLHKYKFGWYLHVDKKN